MLSTKDESWMTGDLCTQGGLCTCMKACRPLLSGSSCTPHHYHHHHPLVSSSNNGRGMRGNVSVSTTRPPGFHYYTHKSFPHAPTCSFLFSFHLPCMPVWVTKLETQICLREIASSREITVHHNVSGKISAPLAQR